jgi:Cu/Ag efflux protein CusF
MIVGALAGTISLILFTSCSSTPAPAGTSTMDTSYQAGVPGGTMVHTFKTSATVTGIDPATRQITIVGPDGVESTVKAGPEVANFDQIKVGDQVKATVTEQIVVFMNKNGSPAGNSVAASVAVAPEGAKPGIAVTDTTEITAKVKSVDVKKHTATLRFANGKTKTFPVRPDVDLSQVKPGEEVVFRATQAVAIGIEKP